MNSVEVALGERFSGSSTDVFDTGSGHSSGYQSSFYQFKTEIRFISQQEQHLLLLSDLYSNSDILTVLTCCILVGELSCYYLVWPIVN